MTSVVDHFVAPLYGHSVALSTFGVDELSAMLGAEPRGRGDARAALDRDRYSAADNRQACDEAIRRCKAKGLREPIVLLIELRDLAVHFDNGGIVWPCQKLLAERCRVSVRTIRRWIKKLEDARIVRVWRQRPHRDDHGRWTRKTNRYLTPLAKRASALLTPRGHARPHDPSLHRRGAGDRATALPRSLSNGSFLQQEVGEVIPMADARTRWGALRAVTRR